MRVALISDIHGNAFALDVALADLRGRGADQIVCLGDTVQGGAQPAEAAAALRALGCPVVMGNADAWLLAEDAAAVAEATSPEQRDVRTWTRAGLSVADRDFIRGFRPTVELPLKADRRLLCFHGSPASFDDILLPTTPQPEWDRLLGPHAPAIMAGGHTHTQQVRRIGETLFINPGSIGAAYDLLHPQGDRHNDAWAEYAVLSDDRGCLGVEFYRIPYDAGRLIDIVRGSGRPHADRMIASYLPPGA